MDELEGYILMCAEDHRPEPRGIGCICGFCVWSGPHVAIMAYRDALEATRSRKVI